jgi:hypothetical protein
MSDDFEPRPLEATASIFKLLGLVIVTITICVTMYHTLVMMQAFSSGYIQEVRPGTSAPLWTKPTACPPPASAMAGPARWVPRDQP